MIPTCIFYIQLVEADTLTEIFRDNAYLCGKVTESEIQHFIHCIEKSRNVKYLKFLQTIVQGGREVGGQGSRRAQEMVMNEVRKEGEWERERGVGEQMGSRRKTERGMKEREVGQRDGESEREKGAEMKRKREGERKYIFLLYLLGC